MGGQPSGVHSPPSQSSPELSPQRPQRRPRRRPRLSTASSPYPHDDQHLLDDDQLVFPSPFLPSDPMARRQSPLLAVSLGVLYRVSSATAYSWLFQQPPTQCGNVTVTISGTDGRPPYRILIIPTGPSPLANGIEARKIQDIPFDPNANSLSFRLPYPANSQFIAVVSCCAFFKSRQNVVPLCSSLCFGRIITLDGYGCP